MTNFPHDIARRRLLDGLRVSLLAAGTLAVLPPAAAQLYARTPPPGSTFIRVANGTPIAGVPARIGVQAIAGLPPFTASGYLFLQPGPVAVMLGATEKTYPLLAGHYYTVAHTPEGQKLFDLKGFTSQLKSMVVLFNLLPDTALSLKTADGKTAIFENIAPYSAVQREINPLSVQLALFKGSEKIMDVPMKNFERGQPADLVVGGSGSAPTVTWTVQQ